MNPTKSSKDNYDNIKALINSADQDFEKFLTKKVKVSGTRVRNNLLNIKKLCDTLRKQIQVELRELPTHKRGEPKPIKETPEKVKKPRKPRMANKTKPEKPKEEVKQSENLTETIHKD